MLESLSVAVAAMPRIVEASVMDGNEKAGTAVVYSAAEG
jgi:hypothetical protein